jgi:hypothetical protein
MWAETEEAYARVNGTSRQITAVKAWAKIHGNGSGTFNILDSFNVVSAASQSSGTVCRLTFNNYFTDDDNCGGVVTSNDSVLTVGTVVAENATPCTYVDVRMWYDSSGWVQHDVDTDSYLFTVVVVGELD